MFVALSHLVAGLAARLQPFGVVPAAVDLPVLVEVDEVDQQLAAGRALETLGVPAAAVSGPTGKHCDVSTADLPAALEKQIWVGGGWWRVVVVIWVEGVGWGAEGRKLDALTNAQGRAAVPPVIIKSLNLQLLAPEPTPVS